MQRLFPFTSLFPLIPPPNGTTGFGQATGSYSDCFLDADRLPLDDIKVWEDAKYGCEVGEGSNYCLPLGQNIWSCLSCSLPLPLPHSKYHPHPPLPRRLLCS